MLDLIGDPRRPQRRRFPPRRPSTAQHAEASASPGLPGWPGIASSATAVLVGHLAGGTQGKIRVGSGGIMLPNHAPLVVAEAFGTLAELYPGRIDLGPAAPRHRRHHDARPAPRPRRDRRRLPREVAEVQKPPRPGAAWPARVAMPGADTNVPIWILGSSLFSARLAAEQGLPTPSPRTSRRARCCRPSSSTAASSKPSAQLAEP